MLQLLKLEWYKLRKYFLFRAIIILYILLLPASTMILKIPGEPPKEANIPDFFVFPHIWESVGYAGNWLTFFVFGFLAILMVTNEYSFKTFRQNVMAGISREAFLTSKVLMMLCISIFAAVYYVIVSVVLGFIHTDYIKDISYVFESSGLAPRFFLMTFAYMSLAFFIGLLTKRPGIALLIFCIYGIFVESILRYFVHVKLLGMSAAIWYYPVNAMEDLVYPDFFKNIPVSDQIKLQLLDPTSAVITTLIYLSLFLLIGMWHVRSRDL